MLCKSNLELFFYTPIKMIAELERSCDKVFFGALFFGNNLYVK
jgi:hypothetical protein